MEKEVICSAALCICEYENCKKVFSLIDAYEDSNYPTCPHCKKVVTAASHGYYDDEEKGYGKWLWVDEKGEWNSEKPKNEFSLLNWRVIVECKHNMECLEIPIN